MNNRRGVRRGPYNKIVNDARARVINEAENSGDWKMMAQANGIAYKTAFNWVNSGRVEKLPRGGDHRSKLSEEHVAALIRLIENEPQITLREMCVRLERNFGLNVCKQTVSKKLDGQLISCKKVHTMPVGMNTPENKAARRNYVEQMLQHVANQKTLIFIDETNFNVYCRRTQGRALQGRRAVVKAPNSKGPNIHIIGAMTSTGICYWERRRGAYKKDNCREWLRRCLRFCNENHNINYEDVIVILDNAPVHSQLETVFNEEEFTGGAVCRLAPYSPMLNPIEHIWSSVKASCKNQLQTRHNELW